MLSLSNGGFLSPDGASKSFDKDADGYSRGEGFSAVILKTLSQVIRDGDPIRSIIRSTGVNTNGQTPSILTKLVRNRDTKSNKFPSKLQPWPTPGLRRASINKFGFGGANAHAVLDDALHYLLERQLKDCHSTKQLPTSGQGCSSRSSDIECADTDRNEGTHLLVLSASDERGLKEQIHGLTGYCRSLPQHDMSRRLHSLSYTLSQRRSRLQWRSYCLVAGNVGASRLDLTDFRTSEKRSTGAATMFIFTDKGAQWHGMGLELLSIVTFASS